MNETLPTHPVVVIGSGPVGLAAAAHLRERNIPFLVLESGPGVGATIQEWGHVRLFSPWRYNVDDAARRLLETRGWVAPHPDVLPLGQELVEQYLAPLGEAIGTSLRTDHTVTAITRLNMDKTRTAGRESAPYVVRFTDDQGDLDELVARSVIDASGTWKNPNPLGRGGLPALGEQEAKDRGRITDPLPNVSANQERFAGKRVLVVGGGHSAANTLLELAELHSSAPSTHIDWLTRSGDLSRVYGGGDNDELAARGSLGSRLRDLVDSGTVTVHTSSHIRTFQVKKDAVRIHTDTPHGQSELIVDIVVPAAGFRPDQRMSSELRLDLDPAVEAPSQLGPMIDAEFHSCGTVTPHGEKVLAHPETGFYIVGMKSYGRAPTFLMATGYEQVRSISAALAGDREAADAVHLDLPETGVCSANLPTQQTLALIDPELEPASACCA